MSNFKFSDNETEQVQRKSDHRDDPAVRKGYQGAGHLPGTRNKPRTFYNWKGSTREGRQPAKAPQGTGVRSGAVQKDVRRGVSGQPGT